jgi:hypothetical protein
MRAYIMIVALPVFGMFALVYNDRTYAGFNCTVDCSGHEAGYSWAASFAKLPELLRKSLKKIAVTGAETAFSRPRQPAERECHE